MSWSCSNSLLVAWFTFIYTLVNGILLSERCYFPLGQFTCVSVTSYYLQKKKGFSSLFIWGSWTKIVQRDNISQQSTYLTSRKEFWASLKVTRLSIRSVSLICVATWARSSIIKLLMPHFSNEDNSQLDGGVIHISEMKNIVICWLVLASNQCLLAIMIDHNS